MHKRVILIILDGWGIAQNPQASAIHAAKTPFIDSLYTSYPHTTLEASGLAVGLPDGQMGNSEVGHLNIGAGRVVYQELVKISQSFEQHTIDTNPVLAEAFQYAISNQKKIHCIGLVSDGGVHSHIDHLKGLCNLALSKKIKEFYIHAFTDGRDTDPKSGVGYLTDLQAHLQKTTGQLASVTGRYYAMDRDKRWERVKVAYDALVHGKGIPCNGNLIENLQDSYQLGITDEFLLPIIMVNELGKPLACLESGDVVINFNFRTDRGRQITEVLTQQDFPAFEMKTLPLHYVTFTNYDDSFQGIRVIFNKENLRDTLGEVLAKAGKKQIRIAETEKYPHVTFFFSGGREEPFEGEKRILCPSPKVATYDLQPEMSAYDITKAILPELEAQQADFICLNFANPDMVGHTGVWQAAIRACEIVDQCTQQIVEKALENGYTTLIIADHGNADYMVNSDGSPNTAHTTNLVPFILVDNTLKDLHLQAGKLGNLAPTILELMGVQKPAAMQENSLLV